MRIKLKKSDVTDNKYIILIAYLNELFLLLEIHKGYFLHLKILPMNWKYTLELRQRFWLLYQAIGLTIHIKNFILKFIVNLLGTNVISIVKFSQK